MILTKVPVFATIQDICTDQRPARYAVVNIIVGVSPFAGKAPEAAMGATG